ncbi:transforming growth factor beta-1 proprotein-like [Asterias rubens]|uniref:transforming growth factor beta-1 proprotein-like n=1 Tax=Asterias rubens TaxID=7604 RepID=UPI0014555F2A|nr:transforming growth factor beta-1 proprotein-like [Asterias rubens]
MRNMGSATKEPHTVLIPLLCTMLLCMELTTSMPSSHRIPVHHGGNGTESERSGSKHEARIEAIKKSILASLNMTEPPSPEVLARAWAKVTPEWMEEARSLYEKTVRLYQGAKSVFPKREDHHQTEKQRRVHQFHSTGSLRETIHFDHLSKPVTLFFSSRTRQSGEVIDGKLKLYLDAATSRPLRHSKKRVECSVYLRNGGVDGGHKLLDTRTLSLRSTGWKTFHITEAVRSWLNNHPNGTELALVVVVSGHSADKVFQLDQGFIGGSSGLTLPNHPRVEILYEEDYDSRRRDRRQSEAARDPYTCTDSDNEEKCCRYAKTVTFRELGWHRWICFPTSFVSYECSGTCPTNHRVATEYSRIKSLMHDLDPTDWGPPCCAPTKLSPLWLMMFNSTGDLEFIEQPDMIVDECKCL